MENLNNCLQLKMLKIAQRMKVFLLVCMLTVVGANDCRHDFVSQTISCDSLHDLRVFLARTCQFDINALTLVS